MVPRGDMNFNPEMNLQFIAFMQVQRNIDREREEMGADSSDAEEFANYDGPKMPKITKFYVCQAIFQFVFAMFLICCVAKQSKYENPTIDFVIPFQNNTQFTTYDIGSSYNDQFRVNPHCIPVLPLKYMLMSFSLLICFDSFFKTIFASVENDLNFKRYINGDELVQWSPDQFEGFLKILKNLFFFSFITFVAWFSFCVTVFMSDFNVVRDEECIDPSVNYSNEYSEPLSKVPFQVKILSNYSFIEPEY